MQLVGPVRWARDFQVSISWGCSCWVLCCLYARENAFNFEYKYNIDISNWKAWLISLFTGGCWLPVSKMLRWCPLRRTNSRGGSIPGSRENTLEWWWDLVSRSLTTSGVSSSHTKTHRSNSLEGKTWFRIRDLLYPFVIVVIVDLPSRHRMSKEWLE